MSPSHHEQERKMDVTRAIQIAVARADLILCRARAALPAVLLAAALIVGAAIHYERRYHK